MSLFLRIFQHLLPTGQAWTTTVNKTLRKFFTGLAGPFSDIRDYGDEVLLDAFPETTRAVGEFEKQFALAPTQATSEDDRRLALDAAWKYYGGQSPKSIQDKLHAAGFTQLFVHEWWASGPPYVARDPRSYTSTPLIGTYQCQVASVAPQCGPVDTTGGPEFQQCPQCNGFLANRPNYLVNKDLTLRPPPPIPDDPTKWPYFIYIGGETFPDVAVVSADRINELERLLLKLRPLNNWIVTLVQPGGVFDDTFDASFL